MITAIPERLGYGWDKKKKEKKEIRKGGVVWTDKTMTWEPSIILPRIMKTISVISVRLR